jgi:2'-5' RNA ligase superfamily
MPPYPPSTPYLARSRLTSPSVPGPSAPARGRAALIGWGTACRVHGTATATIVPSVLPPGGRGSLAGMPDLIPGASGDWETALLLPVPAAEPAVGQHRARLDEAARDGVPAHITVLYPFLPPAGIDETLLASLRRLFAGFAGFGLTLDKVGWFGENVVWLGPRDPAPFTALTDLVFAAFPSCPPYGGRHAEVIPHLTIGHLGGPQALRVAADSVRPCLPIETAATDVILMAGPRPGSRDTPPGTWRTIAAFPLG